MTLSISNPEAERLADEVAKEAGETPAQAVVRALEERLVRLRGGKGAMSTVDAIMTISHRCSALPDRDRRQPEEILGYNERGLGGTFSCPGCRA